MRLLASSALSLALLLGLAAPASAQDLNIDVSNIFGNPTNLYGGAAGQTGFWNNVDAWGGLGPQGLSNTSGAATTATVDYATGYNFAFDNANTLGDDQALLDDVQCESVPYSWSFAGLTPGNYHVYVYGWAPDLPQTYVTNVQVVGGSAGTQACGGAVWSGAHVDGVTYVDDLVTVGGGGTMTINLSLGVGFISVNGVQLDLLSGGGPTPYCTSGTSTNGCQPTISATANPSVSLSTSCQITIAGVEGQKNGIVFYSLTGSGGTPWCASGTSLLCVKAPSQRTSNQGSGGTAGSCNGALVLNWDNYQSTHPGALGQPWIVAEKAFVQGWYRDPPACKTTQLTQALELTYLP